MRKIFIAVAALMALAACAGQPEPIKDYDAPLGKYEIARPAVLAAVTSANTGWLDCPQDTPKWPNGQYRANSNPMPACDIDGGSDGTVTSTPPSEPPTSKPPTSKPPTSKPPTSEPPKEERVHRDNGLGNGDDPAPTERSRVRNRAENQVGNPGHKSGKPQNSN
jgi:hypothetical protein